MRYDPRDPRSFAYYLFYMDDSPPKRSQAMTPLGIALFVLLLFIAAALR